MSQKIPEAIFKFVCKDGKPLWSNPDDLYKYCIEHDMEEIIMHCKPSAVTAEKLKMHAFYHVNILQCAVIGYTYSGYPGVDAVKADYLLRAEFCKDFVQDNKGGYIPIMLDKRNMTKARLLKFIQDAIFFIEQELQVTVPSAEEWRIKQQTGKNFKEIK